MNYCSKVVKLDDNIAKTKNRYLKEMLQTDKDYFFLVEENCKVLDDRVYNTFMDTSKKTGIQALMWPRGSINRQLPFEDDPYVQYFSDFVSSFSMYTREAVKKVGLMDEKMPHNTWQELEYAKRIGDAGLSTPFGFFAAPRNIDQYFEIIKPKDEFKNLKQMEEALKYWEDKSDEEFPINIKKRIPEIQSEKPIIEMI